MTTPILKSDVNQRLWNNIISRVYSLDVKQQHAHAQGSLYYTYDPRGNIAFDTQGANPKWTEMMSCGRAIANYYANVVWSLYGIIGNAYGAYSAYAHFYVEAGRHQTHFNAVQAAVANYNPANAGTLTLASMENQYNYLSDILINNRASQVPDLRVCHGSCHSSCHQSRGRR